LRDSRIRHVILNNGATILHDGVEDKEWAETISASIAASCETMETVQHTIESICGTHWIRRRRFGDCHFFYFDIDKAVFPNQEFAVFNSWAMEKGWDSFLQDRKLYIMPKALNKVHAVSFLQNKIGVSRTFAAGDSIMDLEMLKFADVGFTPLHGEIVEYELQQGLQVVRAGAFGSQDICESILHELNKAKKIS
jgi:hydroxymethylpyrimidine pyrophosphatase-like HAD family hydrolase